MRGAILSWEDGNPWKSDDDGILGFNFYKRMNRT
jgi:hypothetical protein